MMRFMMIGLTVTVAGCAAGTAPEPVRAIGVTNDGRNVLQYTITRSNALGVAPVSGAAIAAQSMAICPGGYTELARVGEATRRISGVIYTDVTVTLVCD